METEKDIEKHESYVLNSLQNVRSRRAASDFQKKGRKRATLWGYKNDRGELILHRPHEEGPAIIKESIHREDDLTNSTRGDGFIQSRRGRSRNGYRNVPTDSISSEADFLSEKAFFKDGELHRPFDCGPAQIIKRKQDSVRMRKEVDEMLYGDDIIVHKYYYEDGNLREGEDPFHTVTTGDFKRREEYEGVGESGQLKKTVRRSYELAEEEDSRDYYLYGQEDVDEDDLVLVKTVLWECNASLHRMEGPAKEVWRDGELVGEDYKIAGRPMERWEDEFEECDDVDDLLNKAALTLGEDNDWVDADREIRKAQVKLLAHFGG